MNKLLALSALVLSVATPLAASAQTAPAPTATAAPATAPMPMHHGGRYHAALASLGLSADQMTKIRSIQAATKAANANADPATHKANAQKMHADIEAVLTPAQVTQLHAAMAASAQQKN